MKEWTKKGREKYAAHPSKQLLANACCVSRQSLSGYAHSKKGSTKAVQTPEDVAAVLAEEFGVGVEHFGQRKASGKGAK